VTLLAHSENPRQRQFARYNRGACYATIIDTNFSQEQSTTTTTTSNAGQVSALARSIFDEVFASESSDNEEQEDNDETKQTT
jgi:hypothetical protein